MRKTSPQTKSFIILFALAVFGTYLCAALWSGSFSASTTPDTVITSAFPRPQMSPGNLSAAPQTDTSGWKTYSNKDLKISFLYKPGWKVLPAKTSSGFTVLQVDPGAKYYNIKIYISPKEFYVMDGLPTTQETIDGQTALNVQNALFGVYANNLFYTFDVGLSMSLVPDFDGLVHSVKFK